MSVEIKGMDEILNKLQQKLGDRKLNAAEKAALKPAGEYVKNEVKQTVALFRDTGATEDEVVVGTVRKRGGENVLRVGWNGPKGRYALVHLNEFGYTRYGKHYTPRGFGKLQATYDKVRPQYQALVKATLKGQLL
ncbi:HK97 gp10 family phage protein [Lactiplantibacillus plantarum]|uniref:HK97 gp10 family phage protein n=1 Tax=Lactiplantibacillus plantarum TaxID=1590 RepID=UPI003965917D